MSTLTLSEATCKQCGAQIGAKAKRFVAETDDGEKVQFCAPKEGERGPSCWQQWLDRQPHHPSLVRRRRR